jgi:hypothetical protein
MKSLRLLITLGFITALTPVLVTAADDKKPAEAKTCDCGKDKDGKACGVDKDCCCTGAKATKAADHKDGKKEEKKDEKKDGKKSA